MFKVIFMLLASALLSGCFDGPLTDDKAAKMCEERWFKHAPEMLDYVVNKYPGSKLSEPQPKMWFRSWKMYKNNSSVDFFETPNLPIEKENISHFIQGKKKPSEGYIKGFRQFIGEARAEKKDGIFNYENNWTIYCYVPPEEGSDKNLAKLFARTFDYPIPREPDLWGRKQSSLKAYFWFYFDTESDRWLNPLEEETPDSNLEEREKPI